jgi:3-hydroxyisobutyrate dehydrogenase-like beta-hydroxyacid dehydrogenase
MKIGWIGFGNMAQAIAKGWIRSGQVTGAQMIASARDQDKLHRVTEGLGMQAAANNAAVCRAADLLVVAVKPAMISDVLLPLQEELKKQTAAFDCSRLDDKAVSGTFGSRDAQSLCDAQSAGGSGRRDYSVSVCAQLGCG